jgi:hypothetical protein
MYSTMSVEVLGKVVGTMTARLVVSCLLSSCFVHLFNSPFSIHAKLFIASKTMEGKGSISLIEINIRPRNTVCRERLSWTSKRRMVIQHGSMMDFSNWRKKRPLPRRGHHFRR